MKRKVALLLSVMMILSCAGCNKSKKEVEKTDDTGISSSENSETMESKEASKETSASDTNETETSASSDATDTSKPAAEPRVDLLGTEVPFKISHDLTAGDMRFDPEYECHSVLDGKELKPKVSTVSVYYEVDGVSFGAGDDRPAAQVISDIFAKEQKELLDKYTASARALDQNANAKAVMLYGGWYEFNASRYRDDSRVISFTTLLNSTEENTYIRKFYNIDAKDGSSIAFSDVVKDKAAVTKYIDEFCTLLQPGQREWMNKLINEETIDFIIYTNGVEFFYTDADGYSYKSAFVPVFSCPDAFNRYYFEATPANNYTVEGDDLNRIFWDIDDDGIIDEAIVRLIGENAWPTETDEPDADPQSDAVDLKMKVNYNEKEFLFDAEKDLKFDEDDIKDFSRGGIQRSELMFTDSGCYLFVFGYGAKNCYVFTFELRRDGNLTFCDYLKTYAVWEDYLPDDFEFGLEKYPIGWVKCYQKYALDSEGKFTPKKDSYYCVSNFVTLKDLKVTKLDSEGKETEKMSLPAGSLVTLTAYNEKDKTVTLCLQNNDVFLGDRVLLDLSTVDDVEKTFSYVFLGE